MKNTEVSYFAGLFDGEGSFVIQVGVRNGNGKEKNKYIWFAPRMAVTLKYGTTVLYEMHKHFDGHIYNYKEGIVRWQLTKYEECLRMAKLLCPYLRIKQTIAKRFIRALELFPEKGNYVNFLKGSRKWKLNDALTVAEIGMNLNPHKAKSTIHQEKIFQNIKGIYVE